jgi:hypothetical protein
MKIKQFFLFLWQLPQEIVGYILSRIWKKELDLLPDEVISNVQDTERENGVKIYVVSGATHLKHKYLKYLSAFSIGRYICMTDFHNELTVLHELGHTIQSRYLGPLYLLLVGIPSIYGNLINQTKHANWTAGEKIIWYYTRYPENWADKLGGVKRF